MCQQILCETKLWNTKDCFHGSIHSEDTRQKRLLLKFLSYLFLTHCFVFFESQMGIILHELGHALGFFHEQSRPDRDDYVIIAWDNIKESNKHNFEKWVKCFLVGAVKVAVENGFALSQLPKRNCLCRSLSGKQGGAAKRNHQEFQTLLNEVSTQEKLLRQSSCNLPQRPRLASVCRARGIMCVGLEHTRPWPGPEVLSTRELILRKSPVLFLQNI